MSLTTAQLATLKAAILADPTANAFPNTSDGDFACAAYLNAVPVAPTQLWRPDVTQAEIAKNVLMSEFAGLTAIKQNGLLLITQSPFIDATNANIRAAFTTIFTSGTSLTNLTAVAQRPGTRFEVIFSSGGPPATSTMFNVQVSGQDVTTARNS
jgi:hypothetical protein